MALSPSQPPLFPALLRAQLLSTRAALRGSGRRGAIFSALLGMFWYGFWVTVAVGVFAFTSDPDERHNIQLWLPAGLLAVMLWWQISPVMTASFGAGLDLRRLLIYPIPRGKLYIAEVMLRLTSCGESLLVVAGGAAGLILNPAFRGWAPVLASVLLFVCFNLLLSAGVRNLIERLFSYRRMREVLVLLVVLAAALPRLLLSAGVRPRDLQAPLAIADGRPWPWAAAAHAALGEDAAFAFPVLAVWTLAAWWFGRRQFERSLRHDAQAAGATPASARTGSWAERLYRLPERFLPDPLASIAGKELRSLGRTPRFRTIFIMGFTFGLLVWLPLILRHGPHPHTALQENFLVVVSLYALTLLGQISYWNSFGFDRSAIQTWFIAPVPLSRVLVGKNLAAALFILLEVLAVTAACLILRVHIPPEKILEAFIVTPIASLYMLALGNLSSVHFPRPMNPEQVSRGGSAGRFQGLLFIVYPAAMLPVVLAYLVRWVTGSTLAFYLVMLFAALLGAAVYWTSINSAARAAHLRREQLIATLSSTQGPVASE
jgi:ABC-2 type transport system permease protein